MMGISTANRHFNFYGLYFFLILALNLNFFYLLDDDFSIIGISISDFDLILTFLLLIFVAIRYPRAFINYRNTSFYAIELSLLFLMLSSSIRASIHYSQPLWYGIRAQREYIIFPFLYFCYDLLNKQKKIFKKDIINVLYFISSIEMILGLLQVFVFPSTIFLHIGGGYRYGMIRFWMNIGYISITFFISLNRLIRKQHIYSNLLFVSFCLLFLTEVTKWRMPLIALFISLFFSVMFFSNLSQRKKAGFLAFSVLFCVIFSSTNIGKDILQAILNGGETDTSNIRELGRSLYLQEVLANPVFGGGFANILWPQAVYGSYYSQQIYWVDNGIFGYVFYFGLIGLLFVLILYIFLFKRALFFQKRFHDFSLLAYLIYSVISLYTVLGLGMDNSSFILPLIMCLSFPQKEYSSVSSKSAINLQKLQGVQI
jgi:hypothetical protein